jgi:hypothetical protein
MTNSIHEDDNGNPTIPNISTKLSSMSHTGSTGSAKHHSPPPSSEHKQETATVAFADVDAITLNDTTIQLSKSHTSHDHDLECESTVEIIHHEDKQPEISKFHDHFTLLIPSSTIRYRDGRAAARVLEANDAQFVLEETYDKKHDRHSVSIRRIHDTSEGVRVLRTSYLIVTAFWTGFLFVFCLQILLFLFLDLAIQAGATTKQAPNWGKAIGT